MSMTGQRRLELERARLEQLRLGQVRAECEALLEACNEAMRSVRDVAVQQFASDELRHCAADLRELRARLVDEPDATLAGLGGVSERIHQAIASGEAQARSWSEAQARAVAGARHVAAQVAATAAADSGLVGEHERSKELAARAEARAAQGDLEGAAALAREASEVRSSGAAGAGGVRVRRAVVKGLLKTLKGMGFVTVGPRLDSGLVVLEGRLASGRKARFEVKLDGEMAFELDGYEGRSCAQDMEKVEIAMRDRFGVKLGPPQVVWKNPDRLTKGAQDLPAGDRRRK